ncbi:DUF3320 domain-containing protein [uncultured Akkermansia sp.]|uniref:DUF3320 domain-containing protein n=1 Tax=uncultured Akkermansia sp. TaxID=512294 RepID=UPI00265CCE27|nr:DUF3320 domain-containing protein [uncultured Akkermansia sp.]
MKKQMAALYEAIAELGIVYCEPPASYEVAGQRIRLCDSLFSSKLGTCIDMALLYASCLEAVGLHPIVVVVRGHAFSGAWLVDDTFADSVNDDVSLLTKRLADGIHEVALVETTCMNAGQNASFDVAMAAAEDRLKAASDFVLSVDVKRCRFAAIRPVPLRVHGDDGWSLAESEPVVRHSESPQAISLDSAEINLQDTEVTKQKVWERKLLDLSLRNNLLNIRLTKSTLQLISVHLPLLEDALADGEEFTILPKPRDWDNGLMDAGIYQTVHQTDPMIELVKQELTQRRLRSYLTETELVKALTHLYRTSRLSLEENGANTLYLALGLLKWYETPQSELPRFAPLLLLPVEMVRKSAQKGYVIRSRDEEVMMNITLLEMLRQDFGISIGGLETLPKDESGVDVKLVFNTIRKGIMNQKGWNVEEISILGIFSFSKFVMWNDIHHHADKLCENRIVKSLISGRVEWEVEEERQFDLDKEFKPADLVLPISADSFQKEAVCQAAANQSFILHGPPGTGKSQTITNIIADSLFRGKKVLFVAEKMAALSVVQKRLSDIGLAPFCLELHSNKATKSSILEQLKATTEVVRRKSPENYAAESERLHALRSELGQYVEELHRKQRSGLSLYDALFGYSMTADYDSGFEFSREVIEGLTEMDINQWRDLVEQLQAAASLCGCLSGHSLREIQTGDYSLLLKSEVKDLLSRQIELLHSLQAAVADVTDLLGDRAMCASFAQFEYLQGIAAFLLEGPLLSYGLLQADALSDTVEEIRMIIAHGRCRDRMREELLAEFGKGILEVDADGLLVEWNVSRTKWFLPRYLMERKIGKTLRVHELNGELAKERIPSLLKAIISYQTEKQWIGSRSGKYAAVAGVLWEDWDRLEQACAAALQLSEKLFSFSGDIVLAARLRKSFAYQLAEGMEAFLSLHREKLTSYQILFRELVETETLLAAKLGISYPSEQWIGSGLEMAGRHLEHLESLRDWCNWNRISQCAGEAGLGAFVEHISLHEVNGITGTFDRALYQGVINATIDAQPVLAHFNGALFEDKIRKFRELAAQFEKLTREELVARLASNIPSFAREASHSSEVGILQRNIRSRGKGTSIRKLFDLIPSLLMRLNPCMLMSPMSVAQYMDADNIKFDLVIFDEASQMPTCEAVGAIARGNQAIIVGDPKQMPPTSFFASNRVDEDHLDQEDLESILDDCLALSLPSRHLLWHYRSKHESLIAFSNSQYYDNKLLTFPSPDDIRSKVTYQAVEGFYDKGRTRQNRAEAEAVIREILIRLSDRELSKRSMGVVTFSSVQQTLIEDLLNEAFSKNPHLETVALESSEPLFVKNLENVQGDERDVILFSVGYGPDEEGKVSLNFGPLNREEGWRRLNVAVSRARYEMKIFSTLRADQIDLARTSSEGVAGLKAFLEYAEKGKNIMAGGSGRHTFKGKSLVDVMADRIREQGYEVHTHIGCSGYRVDMGVVHPERKSEYLLGILCDGENYREAKTVRDREVIQQDVLRLLGWRLHRVWTMDWMENAEKVLSGIMGAINDAVMKSQEKEEEVVSEAEEFPMIQEREEEVLLASGPPELPVERTGYRTDYHGYPVEPCGVNTDEFLQPDREELIVRQIEGILEREAPISREQLCRRVLALWRITRIGSRIDAHFTNLFSRMKLPFTGEGKERFFWKAGQNPSEYMNYRAFMTNAADICPEEVSVAVKEVLEAQISLSREDLVKETAHLFGFSRMGGIVGASMQRGIDMAISRGFAEEENGKMRGVE